MQPMYQAILDKASFSTIYYCSNFATRDVAFPPLPEDWAKTAGKLTA
jgi:hypothetical protein